MTTALRTNTIQDEYERAVPGASIYVYNSDGSLAALTSDGSTVVANPLTSDAFGGYIYYALVGFYREDIWFGGIKRWSENNVAVGTPATTTAAANSILGNNTGSPAAPLSLTSAQTTAMLSPVVGDSGSGGVQGVVPAPASGDAAAGKFLKASGGWAVPTGSALSDGAYGDITVSGGGTVMTIGSAKVSLAKMANLAANSILGNNTGGAATPLALTAAQTTAMLSGMVGDSGSGGTKGLVPAPASGDAAAGRFLKADGTWTAPPGSGAGTTTNALTFNTSGGAVAGTTFNGSAAKTIDFSTIGAAPLASPTFTGTPAAPTAAGGTNTTQIATTAFVASAITAAPLAPLASPALTGTPTAPTAAIGTNTTQLATMAAIQAARSPSGQTVTSAATVTPTFSNDFVEITTQAVGLTLANPTGSAVNMWGTVIRIKDNGSPQSITYGTQYRGIGLALPSTTVATKTLILGMIFNNALTKWDVVSVAQE